MQIKLTYGASEYVLRQTPGATGRWQDCTFVTGSDVRAADAWVVYDSLPWSEVLYCDPSRTIFITGEPQSLRPYEPRFLAQFAAVISPRSDIIHPRVFRQQPAIPWWSGVTAEYPRKTGYTLDYDAFKAMRIVPKVKPLSLISSTKTLTSEHRERVRFVEQLKDFLGDQLDVFGHGFRPIRDKWEAIYPYRYHVVLENSSWSHYWTEKVADTFLGEAYPLYWGCPNLHDYFPAGAFRYIDRDDPAKSVQIIQDAMAANAYETNLPEILRAKELVLDEYNLFPVVTRIVKSLPSSPRKRIRIRPEADYIDSPAVRLKRTVKHLLGR